MNELQFLATISITGSDAKSFLQGQLSNDLNLLSRENALLTSCNSAQGRVQCILTLLERDDGIVAIVPAEMLEPAILRLRKHILRSKVTINDSRTSLRCFSASHEALNAQQLPIPEKPGTSLQREQISILRWWDAQIERYLVIKPAAVEQDRADESWLLADIRAGLPQVTPATHEAFVAQMLNLDALGGISFNKGCYTGQEIIARAHYRGAVKRRMFRLSASCKPPLPASRILTRDNQSHAGDVVMAAPTDAGCEMLAVLNLSDQDAALCLETDRAASLTKLPLPYDLMLAS